MTEREIGLLGFEKESVDKNDYHNEDYYYVYDLVDGLTLISNTESDSKGGQWWIEIFNTDPIIRFHEYGEVQALMNQLESRKVNRKNPCRRY
jgi:hypothetical protein